MWSTFGGFENSLVDVEMAIMQAYPAPAVAAPEVTNPDADGAEPPVDGDAGEGDSGTAGSSPDSPANPEGNVVFPN